MKNLITVTLIFTILSFPGLSYAQKKDLKENDVVLRIVPKIQNNKNYFAFKLCTIRSADITKTDFTITTTQEVDANIQAQNAKFFEANILPVINCQDLVPNKEWFELNSLRKAHSSLNEEIQAEEEIWYIFGAPLTEEAIALTTTAVVFMWPIIFYKYAMDETVRDIQSHKIQVYDRTIGRVDYITYTYEGVDGVSFKVSSVKAIRTDDGKFVGYSWWHSKYISSLYNFLLDVKDE